MLFHISCISPAKEERAPGSDVIESLSLTEITLYKKKQRKHLKTTNPCPSFPSEKQTTKINYGLVTLIFANVE